MRLTAAAKREVQELEKRREVLECKVQALARYSGFEADPHYKVLSSALCELTARVAVVKASGVVSA